MKASSHRHEIGCKAKGFTLIELLIAIAILGILAGISIPNVLRYRKLAEFAALKADLEVLMDAQDAHYIVENQYVPERGIINVPSGQRVEVPEIGYTFREGHKHRFLLYGYNYDSGRWRYNYSYIIVYADEDYNGNGYDDIFYYLTYIYNDQLIYDRRFYQWR